MNVKVLDLFMLIAILIAVSTLFTPQVQSIPTNKERCNLCHNVGGLGSLSVTYLDGSRPTDGVLSIKPGGSILVSLIGIGAEAETEPALSIIFDPTILLHLNIGGSLPGGEGSYSYYVRDGDENDQDQDVSNVKGVFQITADSTIPAGEYEMVASYTQDGPSGVNANLILKVEGEKRETTSVLLLVSPQDAYANKDSVFISGSIRPAGVEDVSVILEYNIGEGWTTLMEMKPQADGSFFFEWNPNKVEEYSIIARWEGNDQYAPAASDEFTVSIRKSAETLLEQLTTGVLLGIIIMLIGIVLFYRAGRGRYLNKILNIGSS